MEVDDVKFYLRKRYFVVFLVFLSWIFLYLMRSNLSISIVDMTSARRATVGNKSTIIKAELDWSSEEKGLLLSAYSWGYMTAPLGAMVADKYGAVLTFGIAITLEGILTILSPILIGQSLFFYLVARILAGSFEGLAGSTFVEILKIWSCPSERGRAVAATRCGIVLGTIIGFPICGTIAFHMSWRAVFYFTGGVSLIWSILWFAFIKNRPENDNLMSSQEKKYLGQFSGPAKKQKVKYPWKEIIASKAVWAYWITRFVEGWLVAFLNYAVPLFIKDAHDVNIQQVGFLSSIPQVSAAVGLIGGSFLADHLRSNRILSVTNIHRLFLPFGQLLCMAILIVLCTWNNFIGRLICLAIIGMRIMMCLVSFDSLPSDMGDQYSCFILACGITFAGVGVASSPLIMGLLVTNHSASQWNVYFLVLACLEFLGAIVFCKFGSGDLQPWAKAAANAEKVEQPAENELIIIETNGK